MSSDLLVKYQF